MYCYLVGIKTKRKFACPMCGPKMKSHHSKSLRKKEFDENRHFLHIYHKFWSTQKNIFNGKEETTSKAQRMTPHLWHLEHNRIWVIIAPPNGLCLEIIYFDCVLLANYVIDDHKCHQGITDHLPKGLKCYPEEFCRLPYYK